MLLLFYAYGFNHKYVFQRCEAQRWHTLPAIRSIWTVVLIDGTVSKAIEVRNADA